MGINKIEIEVNFLLCHCLSQQSKAAGVMVHGVKNQAPSILILLYFYSEKHGPHSHFYLIIQYGSSNSSQHFYILTRKKEKREGEGQLPSGTILRCCTDHFSLHFLGQMLDP